MNFLNSALHPDLIAPVFRYTIILSNVGFYLSYATDSQLAYLFPVGAFERERKWVLRCFIGLCIVFAGVQIGYNFFPRRWNWPISSFAGTLIGLFSLLSAIWLLLTYLRKAHYFRHCNPTMVMPCLLMAVFYVGSIGISSVLVYPGISAPWVLPLNFYVVLPLLQYFYLIFIIYSAFPIRFQDKLVGFAFASTITILSYTTLLLIPYTRTIADQMAYQYELRILVLLIIGSAVFVLWVFPFILRVSLVRPLGKLLEGIKQANEGDLSVQVPVGMLDEFGALTQNFNQMTQSLKQSKDELTEYAETLEIKVADRTAELNSKNQELVVEAALERVRTQSMAMQHSDQLQEVIHVISMQLQELGFQFAFVGFVLLTNEGGWHIHNATPGETTSIPFYVPYLDHKIFNWFAEAVRNGTDFYTYSLTHEEKNSFLKHLFENTILKEIQEAYKQDRYNLKGWSASVVQLNKKLSLSLGNYQGIPYTGEENAIFKRFGAVFDQAYTRFLDLQKAEALAREAVRTASLDRVRAEIASMRTAQDLNRITPLIWRELSILELPFFRCGVFIVSEPEQFIYAYLSTPEGESLTQLRLPIDGSQNMSELAENWRNQTVYTSRWSHEQFQGWVQSMVSQGQIESEEQYKRVDDSVDAFSLQFIPFQQGMLYVGSYEPLSTPQLDLVKSLADAFSVAYARYEDFNQLEEAKSRIEATLMDLRATQTQLIQKEKMASLGELTAGIAHEIQNPLNFVNNFSEVSTELVSELKEEAQVGRTDDVLAIADDLTQNLQKITHHGNRASAIVKGMLEHSRTSTGERRPTNLNALTEEYLRIAYQGLLRSEGRTLGGPAKDKLVSTELVTDFDPTLGKVDIAPQEMGRVLLNLYNNAFYAVGQRASGESESLAYVPTVWVSTHRLADAVEIRVKDNGMGIPDSIKSKIFQPFFTTKPTGEGTGLGLSLSYDIVTKGHGGILSVASRPDEFTEFIITLPFS